jgi:hypothetical protein
VSIEGGGDIENFGSGVAIRETVVGIIPQYYQYNEYYIQFLINAIKRTKPTIVKTTRRAHSKYTLK